MEFAIQLRGAFGKVLEAARWAEGNGLSAFAMPDHYLQLGRQPDRPAWDHLVHLAALARETSRIELVSLISPVTFRHPAVHYKMAVTLDEISDGRFSLGLGTGWMDEEFQLFGLPYPELEERYERTEESLGYIRAALSGSGQGFSGKHYQLAAFDPQPRPQNLKLVVGGTGKAKTPRLAGLYADDYNIYVCRPEEYSAKVATAKDWSAEAGRNEGELTYSAAGPAVAARDRKEYRRILGAMANLTGKSPDHIEAVYKRRGFPHGHGNQPSEMLAELEEAGCRRMYLQMMAAEKEDYDQVLDAYKS